MSDQFCRKEFHFSTFHNEGRTKPDFVEDGVERGADGTNFYLFRLTKKNFGQPSFLGRKVCLLKMYLEKNLHFLSPKLREAAKDLF